MKISKLFGIFATTLAFSSAAMAQTTAGTMWEIWTGSMADFTITNNGSGSSPTQLNILTSPTALRPSIGYMLGLYNLELKVSPSYTLTSTGGDNSVSAGNFRILGGLNYSIGEELMNSLFIEAQAGVTRFSDGVNSSNTVFTWEAGLGKRFKLSESIAFSPQFMLLNTAGINDADAIWNYSFVPVQFSLFL